MTTTDRSDATHASVSPVGYQGDDPTVHALRTMIFGPDLAVQEQVRALILRLGDVPQEHLTHAQEAGIAPDLLRAVVAGLGGSASDIAADTYVRGALCDWAAVAAPHLLPVLTGHFDLAIGAILTLGNGSDYQRACLAELDDATAIGVLALTELGGTNGADQLTEAHWDRDSGGFRLHTPSLPAAKFMPNVADPTIAKTAVVTARLIVGGRDEGVLPFLLRLRTDDGLADGVEVVALPGKLGAAMDHAMIRFTDVWLPADALLGGDWATIDADGRFDCALPVRRRFHAAIDMLGNGRLDLATAAAASARAALAGVVHYSRRRRPGGRGIRMADRDAVRQDLTTATAAVYVTSVFGRALRDRAASPEGLPAVWSMLAKPLLTATAQQVLLTCRERAAAQGILRCNFLPDWLGNVAGMITAEGENQILHIAAGKTGSPSAALQFDGTPAHLPWWARMIADREQTLAHDLYIGTDLDADRYDPESPALGRDCTAIDLANTTAVRLAVTAVLIAAEATGDPAAAALATSAAAVHALNYIRSHGTWYAAHKQMPPHRASLIHTELRHHCRVLATDLATLVAAFDIPHLPDAPLFAPDHLRAWRSFTGWRATTFPRRSR